jgi:Tfp pilus assembly protein PilF
MPSATIESICLSLHFRRCGALSLLFLFPWLLPAKPKSFTIEGEISPRRFAMATIQGINGAYSANQPVYWDGKFKFKKLPQGSYVVVIYVPRIGEFRQTYSVGPGTADSKGRVKILIPVTPSRATRLYQPKDRFTVSIKKLNIPEKAQKEFEEARKKLAKGDKAEGIRRLEKAVEIAPEFAAAWNNLGTVAYSNKEYDKAEGYFRESLKHDPNAFEPLVNLGGVLLNQQKYEDAMKFNMEAVLMRPKDALANSQLGMNYYFKNELDMAIKYLSEARRLDPGHFSNPQLTLSEIFVRRRQPRAAAAELENFLRHHPDYPESAQIRAAIDKLRSGS